MRQSRTSGSVGGRGGQPPRPTRQLLIPPEAGSEIVCAGARGYAGGVDAGKPDPIDDVFIDWLFRAYVGTREIHERTPEQEPGDPRLLVAVSDSPSLKAPQLFEHDHGFLNSFHIWVVSPAHLEQARDRQIPIPEGFERPSVRTWRRSSGPADEITQVDRLALSNFRCFEQPRFSFGSGMNVLIGRNGAGKTTILDALAVGLAGMTRPLHPGTSEAPVDWLLGSRDVRVARIDKGETTTFEPQLPARIDARLRFLGEPVEAGPQAFQQESGAIFTGPGRALEWPAFTEVVRWAVQDGFDVTLPLVAYYGTGRTWRTGSGGPSGPESLSRLAGYEGCLSSSIRLSGMRAWFRRMELVAYQDARTPAVLEASKRAILACLDGFDLVRFDARLDDLAARSTATGLLLPFAQLSDGQRNMLGMIADLAYRAATLNPHLGANAPEQTPGVVLIDEVDLHLHPAWQRRVLPDLMRAFPKVQFIVTTHSPQVLSTAPSGSVRLIDAEHRERSVDRTLGKDSNALLEDILGVPARPQQVKDDLEELARKIEDGEIEAARALLVKLAAILGEDDAEVTSARWELAMAEGGDAAH